MGDNIPPVKPGLAKGEINLYFCPICETYKEPEEMKWKSEPLEICEGEVECCLSCDRKKKKKGEEKK